MKKAEVLHGEHVEADAAVDEGLGNGHVANSGRAEHREHTRAGGGDGVVFRIEGEVSLGRGPAWRSPRALESGANQAKERLDVTIRGRRL